MISYSFEENPKFVRITDIDVLVEDNMLMSKGKVWKTYWLDDVKSCQCCLHAKETKQSVAINILSRENYDSDFILSYEEMLKKLNEFVHIETGLTSCQKDAIAIDIDGNYDLHDIWNIVKSIDIPCVLTRNDRSMHWQIQFYFDESIVIREIKFHKNSKGKKVPSVKKNSNYEDYSTLVRSLAEYFRQYFDKVDIHYTGFMMRNPFHNSQRTFVANNGKLSRLSDIIGKKLPKCDINELVNLIQDIKLRKNVSKNEVVAENKENSRHWLELYYGRKYMWDNIRNGYTPEVDELTDYLLSIKEDIAEKCGKDPHSDKEILSQVESIYEWSIKNFKRIECKNNSKGQWESSRLHNHYEHCAKIRRASKLRSKYIRFKKQGMSIKEIAELFSMSVPTLYTYIAIFAVMMTVETRYKFQNMTISRLWEDICEELNRKIKTLLEKIKRKILNWTTLQFETDDNKICDFSIWLDGNAEYRYAA